MYVGFIFRGRNELDQFQVGEMHLVALPLAPDHVDGNIHFLWLHVHDMKNILHFYSMNTYVYHSNKEQNLTDDKLITRGSHEPTFMITHLVVFVLFHSLSTKIANLYQVFNLVLSYVHVYIDSFLQ